jgi:hypothetical protein
VNRRWRVPDPERPFEAPFHGRGWSPNDELLARSSNYTLRSSFGRLRLEGRDLENPISVGKLDAEDEDDIPRVYDAAINEDEALHLTFGDRGQYTLSCSGDLTFDYIRKNRQRGQTTHDHVSVSPRDLDESSPVFQILREFLRREVKQASVMRRGGGILLTLKSAREQQHPGQFQRADIELHAGGLWDPPGIWKARSPNGAAEAPGPTSWPRRSPLDR